LGPAGGAATVRDSAGITIVENTGTGWTVGEGWAVADTPTVDIGGDERDPRYDLGQVAGAVLLSDGRIAIANGATSEIRFYDPGGGHLSSAGRRGSGPGEYQALVALWLGAGDSVLTFDPFARRITVVPPDGGPPRTLSLGGESGMPIPTEGRMSLAVPTGRFADGTLLGVIQGFRFNDPREGRYRDTVAYVRYGPDGAVLDTVAQLPGLEMEQMTLSMMGQSFSTPTAVPLGRTTPIGIGGTRIAAAMNDRYEIELRDASGRLERLIRLDRPAAPITGEDQAGHRKEQLEQMEDQPGMSMVPGPMKAHLASAPPGSDATAWSACGEIRTRWSTYGYTCCNGTSDRETSDE
jgi:hypothetical protein